MYCELYMYCGHIYIVRNFPQKNFKKISPKKYMKNHYIDFSYIFSLATVDKVAYAKNSYGAPYTHMYIYTPLRLQSDFTR